MNTGSMPLAQPRLALDAMGADGGVEVVVAGLELAFKDNLKAKITLYGREGEIRTAIASRDFSGHDVTISHAEDIITMDQKPTSALRRGRKSSMWAAIAAIKSEDTDVVVSSGNTGALMAMSILQLRMIAGIDRPAIAALWPSLTGKAVVLDVGANVEASAEQLVQFAIMGEAYFRALTNKSQPSVGLLNIGSEELKGHSLIRAAAGILREADPEMAFQGFVEGNDISQGNIDVVVTDGFTGNVALKTAEGTAHLAGGWIKDALTSTWRSKLAALIMIKELRTLKDTMNPSRINGAPLLGLNGLVVKSHGGADPDGVASAIMLADRLARSSVRGEIADNVQKVKERVKNTPPETDSPDSSSADSSSTE